MALGNRNDASFFTLIHESVTAAREGDDAERREAARHRLPAKQRIAPRHGSGVPDESEFVEVVCHDLTRGGFSFFLPNHPGFDSLVAALDAQPTVIYVAAEVSHYADVLVSSSGVVYPMDDRADRVDAQPLGSQSATPMVLVGCRFTERLHQ